MQLLSKACYVLLRIILFQSGGWGGVGGLLEKGKIKLNSTQIAVEVEVIVELGNKFSLLYVIYSFLRILLRILRLQI